jgi:hypothetical protein
MKIPLPERHPLPWRVTDEYQAWLTANDHNENPPAIVDANGHTVVSSSEWLHMEADVADMIVAAVNSLSARPCLELCHDVRPAIGTDDVASSEACDCLEHH